MKRYKIATTIIIVAILYGMAGAAQPPWLLSNDTREKVRQLLSSGWKESDTVPEAYRPGKELIDKLTNELSELQKSMEQLPKDAWGLPPADVAVWSHAVAIPLMNDEWYISSMTLMMETCLEWGKGIAEAYRQDPAVFRRMRGSFVLGHRSGIDRTAQPYGVTLPGNFDPGRKEGYRLWVYLHGHTSWVCEPPFILTEMLKASLDAPIEEPKGPGEYFTYYRGEGAPRDENTISVRVFGRFNAGYRGPSETEVWEVIEDVSKRYPIDPDKIVLNGFSMGGAGPFPSDF